MARKLWQVSRALNNVSPFSDEVLRHTEAQLDFILEMFAADHPDEYRFKRGDSPEPVDAAQWAALWEGKLTKDAREQFLSKMMPSKAVFDRIARMTNAAMVLKKAASGKDNASD